MCLLITSCGHILSGKYTSESGRYSIKFSSNGNCTWYQSGSYFNGKYYWDSYNECYYLEIMGNGLYSNTTFIAEPSSNGLIVSGGTVRGLTFTKTGGSDFGSLGIVFIVFILFSVFIGGGIVVLVIVLTRKKKTVTVPVTTNTISQGSYCPFCGNKHDYNQNFCMKCGRKLN